ncbi:unnamed protein product [Cylindrotheca closterium]|nr:unnamed protein product [Cylindrotheca closterium]
MATELQSTAYNYTDVFFCSGGFGRSSGATNPQFYRHLGCTSYDSSGVIASQGPVSWVASGSVEDGWAGMEFAMRDVTASIDGIDLLSHCATIDKNLILVTDEDRDDRYNAVTATSIANLIDANGYVLNVIVNIIIDGNNNNFGMKIGGAGSNSTIFQYDTAAADNYITYNDLRPYTDYVTAYIATHPHYTELIVDKPGAVWSVNTLRAGGLLTQTFADVFVEIKVQEIAESGDGGRGELGGDPHITTWRNEHYEYHGQCDLVMMKDPNFANSLGLDIHIRTKIVRYWSYIKTVAIKIGNDILEIEGSPDAHDAEAHYWVNYEYQGELDTFAGFSVSQKLPSAFKRSYIIDLSSKYPGQSITVQLYKEFVRIKLNGNEAIFGNTVGLLGDYKTGATLGRDGVTIINDFTELGDEWQVLPSDGKLFHEVAHPQFPEACIKPEDPRGERKRRLSESKISIEQAETACAALKDPLAIKDCVYDILATQDLDMVGAF